ncbi:hypothetical protein K469DRAFT_761218 [Zopfia rhizophila CBS 207.26]|uniref:C2H2-type domain-containing protein n=1 Tax=Zopfia rhizophila CBS 207.26 TaxID=1314779 RepID=A0A6A6DAQ8_9PEZI|nr:hypothetical protein K469DRAFT_761218 [Zopfia rhizophila CBS 207.26]
MDVAQHALSFGAAEEGYFIFSLRLQAEPSHPQSGKKDLLGSAPTIPSLQLYPTWILPKHLYNAKQQHVQRPASISVLCQGLSVTASPLGSGINLSNGSYKLENLLTHHKMYSTCRGHAQGYSTSTSLNANMYAPTSAPQYIMDYTHSTRSPYMQDTARRSSHWSIAPAIFLGNSIETQSQHQSSLVDPSRLSTQQSQRNSFSDALDAGQEVVAMSEDITQSYGNDGSSQSSTAMKSRTLRLPSALNGANLRLAPQSMMGRFSSKLSSREQRKHKCKICDKRFARRSSLQTHMYSHTGEKPFPCDVEGCGRHFSVLSNLRRHRKLHEGERDHVHISPDDA